MCWTQVCSPFYQRATGLSKLRYYNLRNRVSRSGGEATTGASNTMGLKRKRRSPHIDRKDEMAFWMENQFYMFGQYVPHMQEVHLPVGFSKSGMWSSYVTKVGKEEAMDQSSFGRLWKAEYPAVKINKSTDFAKCNTCVHAKETMDSLSPSSEFRGTSTQPCLDICDAYTHTCW